MGCLNTRTRPQEYVLVFETREGRGNTRTCPCGHVLVFGLWGMGGVSCGKLGVVHRRVFHGGEQVGAVGKVEEG